MINYSFIIPHHNCPILLNRLLNTIPHRDDIEVIVVDDNSTKDKSPEILREDVKLIKVSSEESKGAGHARNVGLNFARGKWLLFADSDDFYDEKLLSILDMYKDSNIDILFFSAYTHYNADLRVENNRNVLDIEISNYLQSRQSNRDVRKLAMSSNVPWNKMFNHKFVNSINARFEEIPIGNDAWFVVYCGYKANNISVVCDKLYYYVDSIGGITHSIHPIEHYYILIDSLIKRNKLKAKCSFWDMIHLALPHQKTVLFNFGYFAFFKYYMYWVLHEPLFIRIIFHKFFGRLV